MTFIPAAVGAALITAGATVATTALAGGFSSKTPTVVTPAQTTVRPNTAVTDALTARRGSGANMRTGAGGAEATSTGMKTKLGA